MSLTSNVGSTDKIIRIVAGIVLVALSWFQFGGLATSMGVLAFIVGTVLVVTALINFCPLYRVLGLNTKKSSS